MCACCQKNVLLVVWEVAITSSLEINKGLLNLEKFKNLKVDVKVNLNDSEDLGLLGNLG